MIVIVLLGLHNIKKINMDHPAYVKFNKQLLNTHMLHKEQHLDKCKSVQICSSVLFNRSLRGDEWFWMSGQSMNFLNWPQDFVPDCYSSTCGGMTSTEHLLWQDQPCEESLNFICQSGLLTPQCCVRAFTGHCLNLTVTHNPLGAQDGVQRVYFDSTAIATRS